MEGTSQMTNEEVDLIKRITCNRETLPHVDECSPGDIRLLMDERVFVIRGFRGWVEIQGSENFATKCATEIWNRVDASVRQTVFGDVPPTSRNA